VAAVDLNGDGKLDLVTPNADNGTIGILFGNGNGTFQAPVTYAGGNYPIKVAVADFNGDGKAGFPSDKQSAPIQYLSFHKQW
jgi:hypothetical protein